MRRALLRIVVWVAAVALAAGAAYVAGRSGTTSRPPTGLELRPTPSVITAIQDVARLETTEFHVEKVVEVSDSQSKLWGLVQAKDALLLVAAGDVSAGVDLGKVGADDVHVDSKEHAITVRLPAPIIIASTLDPHATHVYSRSTDLLAARNEELEGDARRVAEEQMRKAAIDGGIFDRARTSADRTLRALLRSMGFERIELDWADRV